MLVLIAIPHIAIPPFIKFKVKKAHKDRRVLPDALCAQLFMPNIPASPPLLREQLGNKLTRLLSGLLFSDLCTCIVSYSADNCNR